MRCVLAKVTEGSVTYFNCPRLTLIAGTKIKLGYGFIQVVSKLYVFRVMDCRKVEYKK